MAAGKCGEIMRFKSDNCSTHYKCWWVFHMWQQLSMSEGKTLISYFGPSGHGKGLVDAMSGFGVKGPLKRAVINNDFSYRSAEEIYTMLNSHFANCEWKHYKLITLDEFEEQSKKKSALPIPKCQEKHMFAFFPDGSLQAKINMFVWIIC